MKTNFGFKIGDNCVFKDHPNYSYAKILRFVKVNGVSCAECEHTIGRNDLIGFIRTFKLRDLKKWKPPQNNAEQAKPDKQQPQHAICQYCGDTGIVEGDSDHPEIPCSCVHKRRAVR
jgi:hypothetical protein